MWNLLLVTICASVLAIVSSDPENFDIGKKETAEHHKIFKQKSNDHHGATLSRFDKPVPSLKEHNPNKYTYTLYADGALQLKNDKSDHKPNYGRYTRQSKYYDNSRHNREPHDFHPGHTPDDYDEILLPTHHRGSPLHSHHRGPYQEPHQRGPHLPPHYGGPPPRQHYRGPGGRRGPSPHHRGPGDVEGPPPHHGEPGVRGPPPHHRGPGGGVGPPPYHRGPPPYHKSPFDPHHGDRHMRPQPPHFNDDGPPTPLPPTNQTTNQSPPYENQTETEKLKDSNRNKPSKSIDKKLPTMESVSDENSTTRSSTTEEEFILDVRIGNFETEKPQNV
ncbi:unnamed protein product [Arctia plantaginis]|uniref:Uncharacterized protein n=1 Tax=Arctia plantaginis TaxID=874455 RepID=A0A8S0YYT5_ARCPL|nr:unnamed protein product [Arctia plantaginis]